MTSDYLQKENLAGVIVLYNPDNSTVHNIASYISCLSHLYVIDNSGLPDDELTAAIQHIGKNISYHPLGDNLGIATALNKGCGLAALDGYKWVLTMDQDSHFENSAFFESVLNQTYNDVAIITASYNNIQFKPMPSAYAGLLEVGFVITSGNILNLAAWAMAGRFTDKLFIDEVDNEFCTRAGNKGFKILASGQVYLRHKLGENIKVKHFLTGKERTLTKHSPLRVYYTVRNNFYIVRKFLFSNSRFVANRIRNILTLIFKILIYFPDKKTYFKYIGRAIKDSLKGSYGKYAK